MQKIPKRVRAVGKIGALYKTPIGRKKVGVKESCEGVTAWRQITATHREPVYYGLLPPHQ